MKTLFKKKPFKIFKQWRGTDFVFWFRENGSVDICYSEDGSEVWTAKNIFTKGVTAYDSLGELRHKNNCMVATMQSLLKLRSTSRTARTIILTALEINNGNRK